MPSTTDPQLDSLFRAEAAEHLEHMNQVLLQIEAGTTSIESAIHNLFRAAHSLKGAARTVGRSSIEQLAHAIESVFDAIRSGTLVVSPTLADTLYDGLDSIQYLLEHDDPQFDSSPVLEGIRALIADVSMASSALVSAPPTNPNPPPTDTPMVTDESMRVALRKLDTMMLQLSNLMMERMNVEQRVTDLQIVRRQHQEWQQKWRRFHQYYIRLLREYDQNPDAQAIWYPLLEFLRHTQRYMRVVGGQLSQLEGNLVENSLSLGAITDALQTDVRDMRLVPFETLSNLLQRAVRDGARALEKQVALQIVGGAIELDKQVLETLKDPLLHILRNAIDHGIETPAERQAIQKQPDGLILISLFQKGNSVHIIISDDGRGIDLQQVRHRVESLGLLQAEVLENMNEAELYNVLMLPGFSTRQDVGAFSGRGVGLDVVRNSIERLQGRMTLSSQPGQWTTIDLVVPVSLSTQHCLLVLAQHEVYAIPTANVLRIMAYDTAHTFSVKGNPMLSADGGVMPLYHLSDALGRPRAYAATPAPQFVIIVEVLNRHYALVVDDVLEEQSLLVRTLPPELRHIPLLSGGTLLADGKIVLILNTSEVIKRAQGQTAQIPRTTTTIQPSQPKRHTILVVDDSITTRTLQKNILEAAGFEVVSATHGLEAMDLLASQSIDLVISDVEMPHLNGFELTERIRQHPHLQQLPIILVTSLDSAEHKARGIRAGADAYIPKGVFDQNELLNTIKAIL